MPKPKAKAYSKKKECPVEKAYALVKKAKSGEEVMDQVKAMYEKLVNSPYKKPDIEEAIQVLNELMTKNADYSSKEVSGE